MFIFKNKVNLDRNLTNFLQLSFYSKRTDRFILLDFGAGHMQAALSTTKGGEHLLY